MSYLGDRDRYLEDYLSLGIGQGYLATATVSSTQNGLTTAAQDVTGTTLTVVVPANRTLRFDAHLNIDNDGAGNAVGTLQIVEGASIISQRSAGLTADATITEFADLDWSAFTNPTPGEHIYKLRAAISSNSGHLFASASAPTSFAIIDIGPVQT